jgi:iron(III) transport system ATP-binding protein
MTPVTVTNLTKRFGEVAALDRVNLEIAAGEIFFLLGPSGCGKTTLLRSIAGFYIPDEGAIFFGAEDVTRLPPHRRNTGMMFQSYALWPHMTVAENVAFGLEERRVPKSEIRRRVGEALAAIRMERHADRRINELSGGQQQRVALARALVIRPRCLLLDEPLSNLDAKLRLEMRAEIRRVCRESSLTAIYVTHDQKEALSIADRLAVMESGVVRQIGSPREVYRRPRSRFVAEFIGETDLLPGQLTGQRSEGATVKTEAGMFHGIISDPEWKPQIGAPALVSVRPESWRLGDPAGESNAVRGRIADTIYLGEMAQYQFAAGGLRLKICELNPRFVDTPSDRDLCASVEPEDVTILPG